MSAKLSEATNIDAIQVQEQSSVAQPDTGYGRFYFKTDGKPYAQNDAGTETDLSAGGGSGASTALDNLATVAINTTLVSDTDSTDDLGSTSIYWRNSYIDTMYLTEQSEPSTPASGKVVVYPKTDGKLYCKDDAGTEYDLTSSGGGGAPTYYIGNYTPAFTSTTSTTFTDMNNTNIKQTVTLSGGETVKVRWFFANVAVPTGDAGQVRIVADDGSTNHTDDNTIVQSANLNANSGMLIECKFTGLSADTYDFTPQWKKNSSGGIQLTAVGVVSWCIEVYS